MNDLIWIGNALYPRWVAFAALGLAIVLVTTFSTLVSRRFK